MGFLTIADKTTYQARPSIAVNKKLTADEFNILKGVINTNYQELLDLELLVDTLSPLQYIRQDVDYNITSSGIYVFFGGTDRTFTVDDAISGEVQIRTVSTAILTLSGNFGTYFGGQFYPGERHLSLFWDSVTGTYTM